MEPETLWSADARALRTSAAERRGPARRGSLFTCLTLSDERDAEEWIQRAVDAGVAYIPGGVFSVDGSGANTIRLTFAKESDERLKEGVRRIARLFFDGD